MTKLEVPKEVSDRVYQVLEVVKNTGKIRKGINEVTKSIERGEAKLVVIATDVSPIEITMHIPVLCDEKKCEYVYVPSKEELGRSVGINVPTSAVSIVNVGEGKNSLDEIIKKLRDLKK
ncbi:50S ribosomal protein L7ae [Candidatus Micrarchaeota archaeon RBG_16_49_10]|nr:MAG: 50S ribosomal protein L7ae [Candidatus Micrarchaeota archaeon RBG_16_49_10]